MCLNKKHQYLSAPEVLVGWAVPVLAAWGQRGARLVSLSPGIIQTAMGQQELEQQPMMQMLIAQTPLRRQGKPEEIASAVDFLLSADASFITGCDLLVDGGVTGARSSTHTPGAH